jgi:hypothetical protein
MTGSRGNVYGGIIADAKTWSMIGCKFPGARPLGAGGRAPRYWEVGRGTTIVQVRSHGTITDTFQVILRENPDVGSDIPKAFYLGLIGNNAGYEFLRSQIVTLFHHHLGHVFHNFINIF